MIISHVEQGVNTGMPLRGSKIDSKRFLWTGLVNVPLSVENALESILGRYSLYQRFERGFSLRIQFSFLPYRANLFI